MDLVLRLIQDNPQFHALNGKLVSWAVDGQILNFLHDAIAPGMHTLETGAGYSTVVFGIRDTHHLCVTYTPEEVARIKEYCSRLGVGGNLSFLVGRSDEILPRTQPAIPPLDFVFIDGGHYFPCPLIDFHYTERHLKPGGILGVDDITMPSVRMLFDFLIGEDEWSVVKIFPKTAFFRKVREPYRADDVGDYWSAQRINNFTKK